MANNRQVWIESAEPEEQGSFSDRESGNSYENVSDLGAAVEVAAADERGDQSIVWDDTADPDDSFGVDQRHNVYRTESDGQGSYAPAKHRVGGV